MSFQSAFSYSLIWLKTPDFFLVFPSAHIALQHRCQLSAAKQTRDHPRDPRPSQPARPWDRQSEISTEDSAQESEELQLFHSTVSQTNPEMKTVTGKGSSWAKSSLKNGIN